MTHRTALLIDGDNVSPDHATRILQIAAEPRPDIARVYGNAQKCPGWLSRPGLRFIHSGTGKNATDVLMAIDAMELALTAGISSFLLASSDGDFTHLALRLRERGLPVTGIGEEKAPEAFRTICRTFHLLPSTAPARAAVALPPPAPPEPAKVLPAPTPTGPKPTAFDLQIRSVIAEHSEKELGMQIAKLGSAMHSRHQARISTRPEKTWRAYLVARPALYAVDPRGPDARVRFVRSAFETTLAP